jgi:hypothetical protein
LIILFLRIIYCQVYIQKSGCLYDREKDQMSEVQVLKNKNPKNMHAIILTIVGVISLIAGYAIANVRGNPLRGSGAGTVLSILGVLLLIFGVLRFIYKRPK